MDIEMPNLYEQNRMLMEKEPQMDPIILNKKIFDASMQLASKKYLMLLCRERYDYTIFVTDELSCPWDVANEISSVVKSRGEVLAFDEQDNGAYEVWIRHSADDKPSAWYLFDYTFGVIECGNKEV